MGLKKRAIVVSALLLLGSSGCANLLTKSSDPLAQAAPTPGADTQGSGGSWTDHVPGRGVAENVPVVNQLPWIGTSEPNEESARANYAQATEAFREKKYGEARASFEKSVERFPNSPLHEDALFMIAETRFFEDDYPDAFRAYEELLKNYKRSRHLDTVVARQFAIGQFWQQSYNKDPTWMLTPNLTDNKQPLIDLQGGARRAFAKVRLNHPTGPLADDSVMATASSHFAAGQFQDAEYYFTLLRTEHPKSEHQYQAHILGIQAKLRTYQGTDYDGQPLVDTKELIEQTLQQFSNMSAEDRTRLIETYQKTIRNIAQRDMNRAEGYERNGYHGSAREYYQQLIADFPRTPIAEAARERLVAIEGKPNAPPRRFTWLSALFPEEEKVLLKVEEKSTGTPRVANADQGP